MPLRSRVGVGCLTLTAALLSGCLGFLDTLGNETLVLEHELQHKERKLEDDRIEDKHPVYDPALTVTEVFDRCEVTLNKSGSVTKLDVLPFDESDQTLDGRLFKGRAEAVAAIDALDGADLIPSMEVVNGALKAVNDGLYAAIELGLQEGTSGAPESKRQLLQDLLAAIIARLDGASAAQRTQLESATVFVAGALLAGGNTVALDAGLLGRAQAEVAEFSAKGVASRPVGFYDWTPVLEEVFRQDRFAQNLDTLDDIAVFGRFAALAAVLAEEPALLERYERVLTLYTGLTNPYASYSPVDLLPYVTGLADLDVLDGVYATFRAENPEPFFCTKAYYALFPASRSKDTLFYNERYCVSGLPPGTSFIDELIAAIRDGALDLAPDAASGWYDYQLWALETLLLPERGPESDHLLLTAAYKKKLIETFESLITQSRETHVKQLMTGNARLSGNVPPIDLYPLLPLEPFPTFYLRTARGYRFLATFLEGVLGAELLQQAQRLTEGGGASGTSLRQELDRMIALTYGLYFVSAASIGLDPTPHLLADELAEISPEHSVTVARDWLAGWRQDTDVLRDPRVIVPVTQTRFETVYWAVIGVKALKIGAEFVEGFEPEIVEPHCPIGEIVPHTYHLLVEQMVEVRGRPTAPPPTRAELRSLCDQYDNADAIVAALEAR